jgi:hypothetical protein
VARRPSAGTARRRGDRGARFLDRFWFVSDVRGFRAISIAQAPAAAPALDLPGLRCLAASPETLLALKVLAHRVGEDEDDLRLLATELGLEKADEVLAGRRAHLR